MGPREKKMITIVMCAVLAFALGCDEKRFMLTAILRILLMLLVTMAHLLSVWRFVGYYIYELSNN